jgi:hypothetical protein
VVRAVGAVALSVLVVVGVAPYQKARRDGVTPAAPAGSGPSGMRAREAERAFGVTEVVSLLSGAVGSLAAVGEHVLERVPPPPPDPATFESPTACARTYLPEVDLPDGVLDFMCHENDTWALESAVYVRVANRTGEGVRRFTRLGRFTLAGVAMIRAGCCVSPDPLRAVVPELWCGILRDKVRALGAAPDPRAVRDYDTALGCLDEHGMRLPERWKRIPEERTVQAFEEFLAIARSRGKR